MRPIDCPETSVRNYHYSLRNDPEERISLLKVVYVLVGVFVFSVLIFIPDSIFEKLMTVLF